MKPTKAKLIEGNGPKFFQEKLDQFLYDNSDAEIIDIKMVIDKSKLSNTYTALVIYK